MNGHRKSDPALAQIPEDGEMNEHMKAMWAGQSNVLVAVRVRPLMKHDIVKKNIVRVLDSKVVVVLDPAANDKQDILRANRSREKQYAFDFVFDPTSSQESVYHRTTKFLIHGVLDGFNATVFAYGQTGSGKTHTMIGSQSDPGIMVRVMDDLFVHSKSQGTQLGVQYKVSVSFLEVYNENIRDLLSDVEEYLDLREDPIKGPVVASITEIEATSGQEIMQLLHQGNAKRSQAATAANEVSSRSHAVLQVVVECRDRAPGTVANIKVGKLSLVDLAGSERAANTKNVGQRLVEGANINRSLLALGNCINALGEKGNKGNFVPYRDSKLTRLLKDSLGGNCRTVMIANISSAESSFEETLNTLKYANRAKNIKTNVQRNVLNVNYHISEYVELINNLRSEIQVLKNQLGSGPERASSAQFSHRQLEDHQERGHMNNNKGVGFASIPNQSRALSPVPNAPFGANHIEPSTPMEALRESLKSGAGIATTVNGEQRELLNNMRQRIVDNFQERMQLRRSLIELEDQNVQNSIEVSKRQLIVVQWSEKHGNFLKKGDTTKADFAAYIMANGSSEVVEAWQECEQLRKAIIKNNGMKRNIAKRLRHNEKEAEHFRDELTEKVTGEDRRELMALQYQVGRLELENMELEQHRIVHESILKGKDLVIQKLKLQLAVKDKIIARQQAILKESDLDHQVGYEQFALIEETLLGNDHELVPPPSPPRNMSDIISDFATSNNSASHLDVSSSAVPSSPDDSVGLRRAEEQRSTSGHKRRHRKKDSESKPQVPKLQIRSQLRERLFAEDEKESFGGDYEELPLTERETALTSRDRDMIEQGEWSEIQSELSDQSFSLGNQEREPNRNKRHRPRQRDDSSNHNNGNNVGHSNLIKPVLVGKADGVGSKLTTIKEPKGVHGPRGGRVYRSSTNNNNNVNASVPSQTNSDAPEKSNINKHNPRNGFNNHDEISDEDSVNQRFQSKYRHYQSPRAAASNGKGNGGGSSSVDKLEPIQKDSEENAPTGGIFSARRIEKEISQSNSISPRDNYAAVYPISVSGNNSNSNTKRREIDNNEDRGISKGGNKDRGSRNHPSHRDQNLNNYHAKLNNMLLNQEDDSVELLDIKEVNSGPSSNLHLDNGLMIKSKPLGAKPILNKIKARVGNAANSNNGNNYGGGEGGNLSSLPSAASLVTAGNSVADSGNAEGLNILGNGFEGMSNRPANRFGKPSVRPIKAMQSRNNNVGAAAVAGSGGDIANENGMPELSVGNHINSDVASQAVGRMRSLPTLNKQISGNMPVSARDKNL